MSVTAEAPSEDDNDVWRGWKRERKRERGMKEREDRGRETRG